MTRTARPLAVALALTGALAVAAPALADPITVTVTATDGTRQFAVRKLDNTALTQLDFGPGGQQPFKTVVTDANRRLLTSGYQVNAQMSNLYLQNANGSLDYGKKVASRDVSLGYAATSLASGALTLPVIPQVSLTGTLGNCTNAAVAAALGLPAPLDPVTGLLNMIAGPTKDLCTALAALTPVTAVVDTAVQGVTTTLNSLALPLGDLPFALTGGQQGGPFTNPSFATGTAGAGDTAGAADAQAAGRTATTKRIMTGTAGITANLRALVDAAVASAIGATPVSQTGAGAKTTLTSALSGLSSDADLLAVVQTLTGLDPSAQVAFLNTLTANVLPVDLNALSTVSGEYSAFPILRVDPVAAAPGTYSGTLTVDFFQS